MKEHLEQNQESFGDASELNSKFDNLEESEIANSKITGALFKSGKEGEEKVVTTIEKMNDSALKDNALFRIAKMYYENNNDINTALQKVNEIQNQDEKTRCMVHLANAVVARDGNRDLADKIIGQITEDKQGYVKYYKK